MATDQDIQYVPCPACGYHLPWITRHVGQVGQCQCGVAVVLPNVIDGPVQEVDESQTELVLCPRCSQWMGRDDVVCMSCGYNVQTGQVTQLVSEDVPLSPMEAFARSPRGLWMLFQYHVLPWVLAVGGLLAMVIIGSQVASEEAKEQRIWISVGRWLVGYGFLFVGSVVLSMFVKINFDTWPQRALRIAAMVSVVLVLQDVLGLVWGGPGLLTAYLMRVPLYFVLLAWLFPMERDERLLAAMAMFFADACLIIISL